MEQLFHPLQTLKQSNAVVRESAATSDRESVAQPEGAAAEQRLPGILRRAKQDVGLLAPHEIWMLHRTIGNQAVARLLAGPVQKRTVEAPRHSSLALQAKLTIGAPDDVYEKEADTVAEEVMSRSAARQNGVPVPSIPGLQRQCACGGHSREECPDCRGKRIGLQRLSSGGHAGAEAPSIVEDVLATPGQPLAELARKTLEPGFGHDFSNVRVHDDSKAAESAASVNALAYTVGNHIVFGQGQYAPGTNSGNRLLAHELTHTIQQTGGTPLGSAGPLPGSRAEMVPGYYASHDTQVAGSLLPISIQRAKIEHRALTWDDFQGKVPKGATFDAATLSGFDDPDWKAVIPKVTSTDTGEPCKEGAKATKFSVDITIDPDSVQVKSFMWQEKSWHQDWLADDAAARKHCLKSSPICEKAFDKLFTEIRKNRAHAEKECRDSFDATQKKAKADCGDTRKDCLDSFGKGNTGYSLGSVTANSARECTTAILPACMKDATGAWTYEMDFDGSKATATTRKECGKEFGNAYEKLAKDTVTVEMKSGDESESVKVESRADCRGSFPDACAKTLTPSDSAYVLSHEQRHFDLSDAIAMKAQSDLQDLIKSFPKEVVDCGKSAAESKAKTTLAGELSKLKNVLTSAHQDLRSKQNKYDAETRHGANADKQKEWSAVIDKGFLPVP